MTSRDDVLKAFAELSTEDQQTVREELSARAAESCCNPAEMQKHMGAMMKMLGSSEQPMDHCNQMMEMCQKMMKAKMPSASEAVSSES